jgi:hypothetical protein
MGKVSFNSPPVTLNAPSQEVFNFLSNLDNMENLMPEQVINWQSNQKSCSFDIKGMTHIHLVLGELIESKLVTIDSGPDNPVDIQLRFEISDTAADKCTGNLILVAELNMMLQMMASTPLQNLVNIMATKLQEIFIA